MWNNIDQDRHYLGQFQIDDETIPGEILYNKKSGIIMLSLKRKIESIGKSFGKKPYISGELNTGAVVTLFKAIPHRKKVPYTAKCDIINSWINR